MITLNFYRLDEKTPENNQEIWIISEQNSSFAFSYGFKVGTVEKLWEEHEPDNPESPTGTTFCYEGNLPPNCHLIYILGRQRLAPSTLWAPCEEIENQLGHIK